jgi:hypothetical protein
MSISISTRTFPSISLPCDLARYPARSDLIALPQDDIQHVHAEAAARLLEAALRALQEDPRRLHQIYRTCARAPLNFALLACYIRFAIDRRIYVSAMCDESRGSVLPLLI